MTLLFVGSEMDNNLKIFANFFFWSRSCILSKLSLDDNVLLSLPEFIWSFNSFTPDSAKSTINKCSKIT